MPTPQDPLRNLKTIKSLGTSLASMAHNLLEVNKTRGDIAQARTHTQMHMNNAWSEMVSSTPCLALYCSFSTQFLRTIWDNSSPTMDQHCRLIKILFFLVLYFYDYE